MAIFELTLHFTVFMEVYLYTISMFEPVIKLAVVNFAVIKIQKDLISEVLLYVKTKIYAIFVLFNMRRLDNYSTRDN